MQISQPDREGERARFVRGQVVRARGGRWRVDDVRPYGSCAVVTLSAAAVHRRLIHPFDLIEPLPSCVRPRVVAARRWRRLCRQLIASDTPPGSLRAAPSARVDVMPHQLEPAMAVVAGDGTRVLLADAVGLGKTVQAGLIVSELRSRGWIDRVLILTPAGLRDQWRTELEERFDLDATRVDAHVVRRMTADLPIGVNPWSTLAIAIASTDYVKRAEVLPAVAGCAWDVLIVDEAHGVEGESDRHRAVEALAARASYVILVTATPHSGDERAFEALCALGSIADGDRLLVFRRTRADVRLAAKRRMHTLAIRPTRAERRMHALLARYADAVRAERRDAWLALSVLHKRAFSGAWALHQSVARRLEALDAASVDDEGTQFALPFPRDPGEWSDADQAPSWPDDLRLADAGRERDLLTALVQAARIAAADESKVAALRRLLRRARESAIVFTEYRDTLVELRRSLADCSPVVLHGGLTRDERDAALASFTRNGGGLLLATDAAGEGLNLHPTCRLVVNLELPWNPMRLEQRVGRVDRIGQTRTVHAFHMVGDGTGETRVLERLASRLARARAAIPTPDPIGIAAWTDERAIARFVVEGDWRGATPPSITPTRTTIGTTAYRTRAVAEGDRVRHARVMAIGSATPDPGDSGAPWVCAMSARLRRALPSCALLIWRVAWENASGAPLESHLVPVVVRGVPRSRSREELRRVAEALADHVRPRVDGWNAGWSDASLRKVQSLVAARLQRERTMLDDASVIRADLVQGGLFDRRAERASRARARRDADARRLVQERVAHVERWSDARRMPERLVLALLP